jgi:hypothetical protein
MVHVEDVVRRLKWLKTFNCQVLNSLSVGHLPILPVGVRLLRLRICHQKRVYLHLRATSPQAGPRRGLNSLIVGTRSSTGLTLGLMTDSTSLRLPGKFTWEIVGLDDEMLKVRVLEEQRAEDDAHVPTDADT